MDAESERGREARARLSQSSGLSAEGVNFALERCLESAPPEAEIETLIRSTPVARTAHVLLSANVFVAAHRAIAIGLAASQSLRVRASRREPEMAELLLAGAPGAFELVPELAPVPGDHLWAYGSDDTLRELTSTLTPGVAFHRHGSGFGVAVLSGRPSSTLLGELLSALAEDVALFDQRGCLSPRVLLVDAGSEFAHEVAVELASELSKIEARIPRGRLDAAEQAAITTFCDSASYFGDVYPAGLGFVSSADSSAWLMPPIGRNLHVLPTRDAALSLHKLSALITSCAYAGDSELRHMLEATIPGARLCRFGELQSPPFDGPVDRRHLVF
jgi:hypothetical protein